MLDLKGVAVITVLFISTAKYETSTENSGWEIRHRSELRECPHPWLVLLPPLLLSRFSRVQLVRPHRWQPTRLPRPWDSPGKNTGVGCHFLLQCMKVKSESEVAQSFPTLSDPMVCSPPGSPSITFSVLRPVASVHGSSVPGILQAGALEWGPSPSPTTTPQNLGYHVAID